MKVGVLDVQGNVTEHVDMLSRLVGSDSVLRVKTSEAIEGLDALVIPGGESTTIGKLLVEFGVDKTIKEFANSGKPIMGTCAGMIVLAKKGGVEVDKTGQPLLDLMDVTVSRNAFGRQRESFEQAIEIKGFEEGFAGVFIRAPAIVKADKEVEVLSTFDDKIIMARQNNLLVSSFHPELTDDTRVHEYFLNLI